MLSTFSKTAVFLITLGIILIPAIPLQADNDTATSKETSLTEQVLEKANMLKASMDNLDPKLKESLMDGLEALQKGSDLEALQLLGKLKEAKFTPDQMSLFEDLQSTASVVVLKRNFDEGDPGMKNQVGAAIIAIQKKDAVGAAKSLGKIASKAKLTPEQKGLIDQLVTTYAPEVKAKTESLKSGMKKYNPLKKE